MTAWTLKLFPVTVITGTGTNSTTKPYLLHVWSTGGEPNSSWLKLYPVVLKEGDTVFISLYPNNSAQPGAAPSPNGSNYVLAKASADVDTTKIPKIKIINKSLSGTSTSPWGNDYDSSTNMESVNVTSDSIEYVEYWKSTTAAIAVKDTIFQFRVELEIDGEPYKGDPEIIVTGGDSDPPTGVL